MLNILSISCMLRFPHCSLVGEQHLDEKDTRNTFQRPPDYEGNERAEGFDQTGWEVLLAMLSWRPGEGVRKWGAEMSLALCTAVDGKWLFSE